MQETHTFTFLHTCVHLHRSACSPTQARTPHSYSQLSICAAHTHLHASAHLLSTCSLCLESCGIQEWGQGPSGNPLAGPLLASMIPS
jgi:hypothetical protein